MEKSYVFVWDSSKEAIEKIQKLLPKAKVKRVVEDCLSRSKLEIKLPKKKYLLNVGDRLMIGEDWSVKNLEGNVKR